MPVAPGFSGWFRLTADWIPAGRRFPVSWRDPVPLDPTGGAASSDLLETEIEFENDPVRSTCAALFPGPLGTELSLACS